MSINPAIWGPLKFSDSSYPNGYSNDLSGFMLFTDIAKPTSTVTSPDFNQAELLVQWLDEYFDGIYWNAISVPEVPYFLSDEIKVASKRLFPSQLVWGGLYPQDDKTININVPGTQVSMTDDMYYSDTIIGQYVNSVSGSISSTTINQIFRKIWRSGSAGPGRENYDLPIALDEINGRGRTLREGDYTTPDPNYTDGQYVSYLIRILPQSWLVNNQLQIPIVSQTSTLTSCETFTSLTIRIEYSSASNTKIICRATLADSFINRIPTSIYNFINGQKIITPDFDPWSPGGNSGPGGGDGDFEDKNIDVPAPSAPSGVISGTDGFNLYRLTSSSFKSLINYMWSAGFDLDTLKKMVTDPMSTIIGSHIVPVSPPTSSPEEIVLGNITASNVFGSPVTNRFVQIDCGTLDISKYSGTFLDFSPYTKYQLFLPFIGFREISADDVTGKTVGIKYTFDVVTGACVAFISVNNTVLYSFSGQAAAEIPLSGSLYGNALSAAISGATSAAVGLASGGVGGAISAVSGMASAVLAGAKPTFERSGAFGGVGGFMGIRTPYIAKTRPRQAIPEHLNEFTGYPTYISGYLNSYKGYTEIESVHLTDIPATDTELTEIETILKGGVIL